MLRLTKEKLIEDLLLALLINNYFESLELILPQNISLLL